MSTRSGAISAGAGGGVGLRTRRGHKERSKNFTELEKRTVLELIARHRDVLRQGRSNNATNRTKQLVWSTICAEVNARCGGGERARTPAQVKMWYENYKKKCKMRAHDYQSPTETPSLLDGMLWQSVHPLDVKDEDEGAGSADGGGGSVKDDDLTPVNMTNGRNSSNIDSDDTQNVLEPHVQIIPQSPQRPTNQLNPHKQPSLQIINHARLQQNLNYLQKLSELTNTPLNLSHLDAENDRFSQKDDSKRSDDSKKSDGSKKSDDLKFDVSSATDEERLYFTAKRQHAIYEHEAKMRILNMEMRQKEEIFSLQKQLFLIELKLKMDFLEKATSK